MSLDIVGNTYPVRDKLRNLGCRWSSARKVWVAPTPDVAALAQALVKPKRAGGQRRGGTCKLCGCRINYGVYCGKCEFS
jgi:hypothetical protein